MRQYIPWFDDEEPKIAAEEKQPEPEVKVDMGSGQVVETKAALLPVKRGPGRPRKVITDKE